MTYRGILTLLMIMFGTTGIFGVITPAAAEEAEKSWVSKIVSVQGGVAVKRHGKTVWQPLQLNDTLFAGDQVRVDANSRAGIVLRNDAVLRLDQNTTLVFTEIEKETTFIFRLLKGAANFFSRRPRSLKILTPFVNGVVEGTEFLVRVEEEETQIDLFEGRLLAFNQYGELRLTRGQGAIARAGSAPQSRLLVKPRDSVQWALYYPPVLAVGPGAIPVYFKSAIEAYNQGLGLKALNDLSQIGESRRDTMFYAFRAALLLNQGSISQARNDIRQSLQLDPENSQALALQAVIAVVQNRSEEAHAIAQKAVQFDANSAAAQLALSYALQARFNLEGALEASIAAVSAAPENGTASARLAELRLSTGLLKQGLKTARKAVALNPNESHAHTLLGFAYLTQINISDALTAFDKAIALDSAAPLPRLGLGLAKIRGGDLKQGRAEIEIAVGLDPINAQLRSYLGKAYFDEKRGPLDQTQLEIAKDLDPNDPTPWFYDAIRKLTLNQPGAALRDLQESIKRNDNRAVYRSRLLLDEDLAARSAAMGRIFIDLSFQEKALRQGAKSLRYDPTNYSAHRLLADIYASRPRQEISQVSALLQSQLLQPLNLTPVPPQAAESALVVSEEVGPLSTAINEFNPLFTRDRLTVQLSGGIGNNDTWSEEVTAAGLYRKLSFGAGQFHYETEGFRPNNHLEKDIYSAFVQTALSPHASIQAEYRQAEITQGDLVLSYDPDDFTAIEEIVREEKIPRLGFHYTPNIHHHFIVSLIYNESDFSQFTETEAGTFFGFPVITELNETSEADAYNTEVQYILRKRVVNAVIGAGYYEQDFEGERTLSVTAGPIPLIPATPTSTDSEPSHSNAYVYLYLKPLSELDITLGLSGDRYDDENLDVSQGNPKFGFNWYLTPDLSVRGAAFRTLKRSLVSGQTIEPVQIAGFSQFFDDPTATEAKRYGIGIDYQINDRLSVGAEGTRRNVELPENFFARARKSREYHHSIYIYWLPLSNVSVSAEYRYDDYERDPFPFDIGSPYELQTQSIPLTLAYFHPCGFFARVRGTHYNQELEQIVSPSLTPVSNADDFNLVDVAVGYRIPKRYGVISFSVKNVFDTDFNFQDTNFLTAKDQVPEITPERHYILKATLRF